MAHDIKMDEENHIQVEMSSQKCKGNMSHSMQGKGSSNFEFPLHRGIFHPVEVPRVINTAFHSFWSAWQVFG